MGCEMSAETRCPGIPQDDPQGRGRCQFPNLTGYGGMISPGVCRACRLWEHAGQLSPALDAARSAAREAGSTTRRCCGG